MIKQHRAESWSRIGFVAVISLLTAALTACSDRDDLALGEEKISADEAGITADMIEAIKTVMVQRNPEGDLKRFNQVKGLGCLDASFTVRPDIDPDFKQGIFAEARSYPARIRFANATQWDDTRKDFRGMSIKVFDVDGEPLWGQSGEQDFLLNSYPALFAADPEDFLDFIEAQRDDSLISYFIRPSHFYSLKIIFKGREQIDSPFAIRYWSTTPYRLGSDKRRAVKYSVQPCDNTLPPPKVEKGPDFLTAAMKEQLAAAPACFQFMVQPQTDPEAMPIEDASVVWDEEKSPFVPVAAIEIPNQEFTGAGQIQDCEKMTFNPWQSLEAHKPIGGINRVRKPVYSEIPAFRNKQ